jgi:chromosome segregation ATPase
MVPEDSDKRLEWLDDQRRKDTETIQRLEKRLASLEEAQAKQARQAQDLAGDVARLSALATRINQFDETLTKHRQEVSRQLEAAEEARTSKEKQLDQSRKRDQAEISKDVETLRKELATVDEVRETSDALREDGLRISRSLGGLSTRIDDLQAGEEEHGRWRLSFEEGRKQDGKRVVDLQTDVSDMRARLDGVRGSLDTVEDRLRRLEVRLGELATGESERREAQSLWMEQQNLRLVDFERSSKDWGRRFEAFEKMAAELDERVLSYEETYRGLKQQREDLDVLMQRLERRITEVSEMQRLSEDRLKQEWSTFQADDQKRWNTYKLGRDELWRDHNRLHEKIPKELQGLEEGLAAAVRSLSDVSNSTQQRLTDLLGLVREWAAEVEQRATEVK